MHGLHFLSQETRKWLSCLCQIESVLLWFLLQSFVIWRDSSLEKCPGFKVFSPWLFSVCGCFRWSMMHDYTSCVKKHSNNCLEMSYRICFVVVICPFYFVKLLSLRSVASVFSGWLFFVFIISNYLPSFSVSFFSVSFSVTQTIFSPLDLCLGSPNLIDVEYRILTLSPFCVQEEINSLQNKLRLQKTSKDVVTAEQVGSMLSIGYWHIWIFISPSQGSFIGCWLKWISIFPSQASSIGNWQIWIFIYLVKCNSLARHINEYSFSLVTGYLLVITDINNNFP